MAKDKDVTHQIVPVGLEQVLFIAAREPDFRSALLRDRGAATMDRGLSLEPSEMATLGAASSSQLEAMIDGLDTSTESQDRRAFMRAVAATVVTIAAGAGAVACSPSEPGEFTSYGNLPDQPKEPKVVPVTPPADKPIEQATPDAGQAPPRVTIPRHRNDDMKTGGIRPDLLEERRKRNKGKKKSDIDM